MSMQQAEIKEVMTKNALPKRRNTVTVLKGTAIEFDPNQHTGQATEIITKNALRQRRNRKNKVVVVIKGTAIEFDPNLHTGQATEIITKNTLRQRHNAAIKITVIKGTTIEFDPNLHAGQATEIITKNALQKRRNKVKVVKGTAIEFDPKQHTGQATEIITKSTLRKRRNKVKVVKGTAVEFDPIQHTGQATEIITKNALSQRRNTVTVLKGTTILFDPVQHAGQATEIITKSNLRKRINTVKVIKGTAVEFDPKHHAGEITEIITKNALSQRRNTVTVLKGTAILFDPAQHTGGATEVITKSNFRQRHNAAKVLKRTAIPFDLTQHARQAIEIITKNALRQRQNHNTKPEQHGNSRKRKYSASSQLNNPENPIKKIKRDVSTILKQEPKKLPTYHDNFNRNIIVLDKSAPYVLSCQNDDLNKIIILMDEDEKVNAPAIPSNHQPISTAQMLPTKAERGKYQGKTVAWMIHDRYTAMCDLQPNYAKKNQCTINLQGKKVRIIIREVLLSLDNPDNNLTVMPLNKSLNKPIKMLDLRFVDPTDHNQIYIRAGMSQTIFTITLLHNSDLFGSFNNLFQGILKHLKSYQKLIILQDDARKTGQFLDLSCCVAGKQNPLYERLGFYPVTGTVTIPSYLDPNQAHWATAYWQTGQAQDALKEYYAVTPFTQFLLTQNIDLNRINQKLMQVSIIYNINDTVQMVHHRILAKMKAAEQNQNEKIKQELLNITEEYLYQRLKINIPSQNNQVMYSPLFFHVPLATADENYHNISSPKVNEHLIDHLIKHYMPMANALAQEAYKQYLYLVANAYAPIKAYVPFCLFPEEVKHILNRTYDCNIQSLQMKKHPLIFQSKTF